MRDWQMLTIELNSHRNRRPWCVVAHVCGEKLRSVETLLIFTTNLIRQKKWLGGSSV